MVRMYWNWGIRGLGTPARMMLEYSNKEYENVFNKYHAKSHLFPELTLYCIGSHKDNEVQDIVDCSHMFHRAQNCFLGN